MAAQDNSRGLHPRQVAPGGGELRSRLYEPLAHVRGPVPGLSIRAYGRQATLAPVQEDSARARGLHPRQFAPGGGELRSRLNEPLAHVRGPVPGLSIRGGCTPGNSRLGAVSCAHACTNRWRACAPGVSPGRGHRWQKAKREKAVANATGLLSLA